MSFTDVNGINICYEIHGDGYPVILVHGFGDKKEHWRAQVGDLSEHFKVIVFDSRGAGKSDRPNEPYTMQIYASDINKLMDFLKIEKANLIGHSLGGMIVQNFAIIYPERVHKIVLIATIPGMTPPGVPNEQGVELYRKGQITSYELKLKSPEKYFFDHINQSFSRKFVKLMKENPKRKFHGIFSAEDLIQEKITGISTPQDINNQANALALHNVYEKLPLIKNEVLIIAGEKDKQCPKSMNEKIHELLPNSRFEVIKDAKHQLILEYAPEINEMIIDFLKD